VGESGLPGFDINTWFGVFAPAKTPPAIVQRLHDTFAAVLAMPDVRKKAEDSGTDVETMTPAQLGAFTREELAHWGAVIKSANITAD